MLYAIAAGLILGFLCRALPKDISSFIVDELASPLMQIFLHIISGITGPVIFISMTTSIIALESINNLTNLGFKIVRRILGFTLFVTAVSVAVSVLFFPIIGSGSVSFAPQHLLGLFFDLIPTNLFKPFIDNNTPQLVILGFLLGSAFLLIGDRIPELKTVLIQINEWMMSAMKIIQMGLPAIPFLSLFVAVAGGNAGEMLQGWKYIAASYIVYTVIVVIKALKASLTTKISISEFRRKIWPAFMTAFTTGSTSATLRKAAKISEKEFHIKPEFTSFWIPMGGSDAESENHRQRGDRLLHGSPYHRHDHDRLLPDSPHPGDSGAFPRLPRHGRCLDDHV